MKKIIKKSLLIVAVLTTMVAGAKELENGLNLRLIDSKLIDLSLNNSDGSLTVRVKDSNDHILYSEQFNGSQFSKKYDLKTLPTGSYFFEIEGETKIKLMKFTVNHKNVEFSNEIEKVYFKPVVRRDSDLIFINMIAMEKEPFTIALYNEGEKLLYKEEMDGIINIGKKLNISKLEKGTYRLLMKSNGKSFTELIIK